MNYRILFVALLIFSGSMYAQSENVESLKKAPNFQLENLDGDLISLKENLGNGPILLSFWATWCKPCIEELGHIQKIYSSLEKNGLKVFAISTDNEKSVAKVKPFIKSSNYDFTVLLDTDGETARDYFTVAVPFTVILDKNGKIVYTHSGYKKGDELKVEEIIKNLLENKS
ncbi:MAG: TlpA disulfide reductase family protein [bacterium]